MIRDHESELYEVLNDEQAKTAESSEVPASIPEARPFSSRNLFVHHDTHPLVLDIKLIDQYGTDWFEWESETLWGEIMDDFRAPSISDHIKSKIQAVKTVHISDLCFTKWEVFCVITQALNNNIPDFEIMRKPTIPQIFAAVDMMSMIRDDVKFGEEVQQWIAASMLSSGVFFAPNPVHFAQDEICSIKEDLNCPVDVDPVKARYRSVLSLPLEDVELSENIVDVQVAKLLIAHDYMQMRRGQMKAQMRALQ